MSMLGIPKFEKRKQKSPLDAGVSEVDADTGKRPTGKSAVDQYSAQMRTNPDKADKEPPGPSARTIKLLMSWEKKYGLVVIRKHLDDGLFSRDPAERVLCYRWLEQRRKARRNNVIVQVVVGVSVALGLVTSLMWPQ